MNAIVQTENEPRQLQRLAAQRYLYSTAKRLYGAQLILAGPIAVMWAGAVAISPNLKAAAGIWGCNDFRSGCNSSDTMAEALAGTSCQGPGDVRLRRSAA